MRTTHQNVLLTEIIELAEKSREGHLVPFDIMHGAIRSLSKLNAYIANN